MGVGCDMLTAVSVQRMVELEEQLKDAVRLKEIYREECRTERAARSKSVEELREERFENMTSKNTISGLRAEIAQLKTVIEVLEKEKTQTISGVPGHKKANVHASLAELKMLGEAGTGW